MAKGCQNLVSSLRDDWKVNFEKITKDWLLSAIVAGNWLWQNSSIFDISFLNMIYKKHAHQTPTLHLA